jgi:hypothetical protein
MRLKPGLDAVKVRVTGTIRAPERSLPLKLILVELETEFETAI